MKSLASRIVAWFKIHQRDLPWRRTRAPYAIHVSEIMLQQTQVKTVIPYWERWMRELPTIAALADAREDHVLKLWQGLGYYSRARNLQKAARQIVQNHDGVFPERFEDILELPGVGRYTAGAIASIAFGQARPIVDGNVTRVLSRQLGANADHWPNAKLLVETAAPACSELNQGLMELGATICLPRQPICPACPIQKTCVAFLQNRIAEFPAPSERAKITERTFHASLIRKNGSVLLRKRAAGQVNAGYWELPNEEVEEPTKETALPLCTIKHTITRYRMTLKVYEGQKQNPPGCKWLELSDLMKVPLVNAHSKALEKLGLIQSSKL